MLKAIFLYRIAHFVPPLSLPSLLPSFKSDSVKNENHRRELSTLRKNLAEAESTIRKFEGQFMKSRTNTTRNTNSISSYNDVRRLEAEIRTLHAENEKLEEKLRVRKFCIKLLNLKMLHFVTADMEISTMFSIFIGKFEVYFSLLFFLKKFNWIKIYFY